MTKTPLSDRSSDQTQPSPSRSSRTTTGRFAVVLTAMAERYADRNGLVAALTAADLGPDCAKGDYISVRNESGRHDFVILRRSWVLEGNATRLEITLDHPARY